MSEKRRKCSVGDAVRHLRTHARVLMDAPIGEQYMGVRDVALNSALHQIADALEVLSHGAARSDRSEPVNASPADRVRPIKRSKETP